LNSAYCDGECVDIKRDVNHCGNCGTKCSADQYCDNGTCSAIILNTQIACGVGLVDCTHISPNAVCSDGVCACPNTLDACGADCTACPTGQTCVNGICGCCSGSTCNQCPNGFNGCIANAACCILNNNGECITLGCAEFDYQPSAIIGGGPPQAFSYTPAECLATCPSPNTAYYSLTEIIGKITLYYCWCYNSIYVFHPLAPNDNNCLLVETAGYYGVTPSPATFGPPASEYVYVA
jgi:hypothetical protein